MRDAGTVAVPSARQLQANHSRIDTTMVYLRALNKSKGWRPFAASPGAPD